MNVPIRRVSTFPAWALAFAALFAFAVPARAAKSSDVVSHAGNIAGYHADGTDYTISPSTLVDGSLVTGIILNEVGAYVQMDFADDLDSDHLMYVGDMTIGHSGTGTYSLYWTDDGTTWNAIAENVQTTGSTTYPVNQRVKMLKYVAGIASNNKTLCEWRVKGYVSTFPQVVSKWSQVSMVNILWGADTFGGGTGNPANVFNGRFGDYQMLPRTYSGSYFLIDLSKNSSAGYFIDRILVDSTGTKKYTLQYSVDGTTWTTVEGANQVAISGIASFEVGAVAKQVKYLFVEAGDGSFSDQFLAEIQVLGMDPEDIPCMHPSFTEWELGLPATCTERAMEVRFCTVCGERFSKISAGLPLGHDYVTILDKKGRFTPTKDFPDNRHFGTGSITCTRCDFRLDFPTAIDLATSRVDNVSICGIKTEGVVRFSDLSVSSTDHPGWGPADFRLIDNVWRLPYSNENLWSYWVSIGLENQYIDFQFGTEIDLTELEFSVKNHGYLLHFFNVDDDTGNETWIGEHQVTYDGTVVGTTTETQTEIDPETGDSHEVHVEKEVHADYQRIRIPFYETPVRHLRIRITDEQGTDLGWGNGAGVCVIEVHPWGTVCGASDFEAEKTTLMLFH